ncbi:hypothetical protein BP5796_03771 [Coleophoma crateriformis]|uniref:Major facilitator superfamily (MFS) profile domain-containing protein n=1 Tax=Coleophoma crateriformis TaxID=565419 RepID=A0A3D8SGL6_9HELO|nr:hypothetical protein BP5796_03771 [Coleophoma crateriformis]
MAFHFHLKVLEEIGLCSLWSSTLDTKLLCMQRFARHFGYGGVALILVAYLDELSISKTRIGLFMTLTLVGDIIISFFLTAFADGLGRKATLALGALLMSASGVTFTLSGNHWVLLLAVIFGVISPSGNEIGPFRAIEESILAQLTPAAKRRDIYAWYSLTGSAAIACAMALSGWLVKHLREDLKWTAIGSYRVIFWGYAIVGIIKFLLVISLSKAVEANKEKEIPTAIDPETAPLLGDSSEDPERKSSTRALLPKISVESRAIILNLCLLFAVHSFASGLAPISWITFFFKDKFSLSEGKLGTIFFVTSAITAVSIPLASSIARRFGNIKTMVFTHLPSSIFLALMPIPSSLPLAATFLILRSSTVSMDSAPRTAFLAAIVLPHERTAVMGLLNVVRTSAQCIGPLIAGVLAGKNAIGWAFVAAGFLKATYDLGMLAVFAGHEMREERNAEDEDNAPER